MLSVVMTVILVADNTNPEEWLPKRRPLLAMLRVAAAFSPVFREHARFMMRVGSLGGRAGWQAGQGLWGWRQRCMHAMGQSAVMPHPLCCPG
jgi:hypothetical protein